MELSLSNIVNLFSEGWRSYYSSFHFSYDPGFDGFDDSDWLDEYKRGRMEAYGYECDKLELVS